MKVYLVGGAVRDELLGRPVKERDWVVVGATPEQLEAEGYRPVGKDFPVFLHPRTKEEYALARTERKVAPGYKGFAVHAAPDVTLEEDLRRRDITINAMARDADGSLIDPYGGREDLRRGVLRHVSPAFSEDPVRILRVARFAARFGFEVAPETLELMRGMVAAGEVDALVAERVWAELDTALGEPDPGAFFEVLRACGALAILFPEIEHLFGVPQPERYHPEIDTGVHTLMVLAQAVRLSPERSVRFAALTHDLGKGATPPEEWPHHHGHEQRGAELIRALCARWRVPSEYRDLAVLVALHHGRVHRAAELRPGTVLELLQQLDALRRPERFEQVLLVCEADARGRGGCEESAYPQAALLRGALEAANSIDTRAVGERLGSGEAIGREIERLRLEAVTHWLSQRGA